MDPNYNDSRGPTSSDYEAGVQNPAVQASQVPASRVGKCPVYIVNARAN